MDDCSILQVTFQDYLTSEEIDQSVGWAKAGEPREKKTPGVGFECGGSNLQMVNRVHETSALNH